MLILVGVDFEDPPSSHLNDETLKLFQKSKPQPDYTRENNRIQSETLASLAKQLSLKPVSS
jgi:hypothetical protein